MDQEAVVDPGGVSAYPDSCFSSFPVEGAGASEAAQNSKVAAAVVAGQAAAVHRAVALAAYKAASVEAGEVVPDSREEEWDGVEARIFHWDDSFYGEEQQGGLLQVPDGIPGVPGSSSAGNGGPSLLVVVVPPR